MKSLIKLFIFLVVACLIGLVIWARPILETAGSRALNTQVEIKQVKFIPLKLAFKLFEINLSQKHALISSGELYLLPPKLEFRGLKLDNTISLKENNFFISAAWLGHWKINVALDNVDLSKLGYGFKKGIACGTINGTYAKSNCAFSGLVRLKNIVYSDTDGEFLGMSKDEFQELIDKHSGTLELDFTYEGPIDKIDELHRYKPGKKTIGLIKDYLVQKLLK